MFTGNSPHLISLLLGDALTRGGVVGFTRRRTGSRQSRPSRRSSASPRKDGVAKSSTWQRGRRLVAKATVGDYPLIKKHFRADRMKSLVLAFFLGGAIATASDIYVVVARQTSVRVNSGEVLILQKDDCLKFIKQENSFLSLELPGIGVVSVSWTSLAKADPTKQPAIHAQVTAKRLQREFALEIPGYRRGSEAQRFTPITKAPQEEKEKMDRVEDLQYFAVSPIRVRFASSALEPDQAFPFLGFFGDFIRLRFHDTYIDAPRTSFTIFAAKDRPELVLEYHALVSRYLELVDKRRNLEAAERQANSLDRISRQLDGILMGMDSVPRLRR